MTWKKIIMLWYKRGQTPWMSPLRALNVKSNYINSLMENNIENTFEFGKIKPYFY